MFEAQRRDRDTSILAWTLFLLLLIGAGAGGWLLVKNLRTCQQQLTQANESLKAERTKAEAQRVAAERSAQQFASCQKDMGTCNTALEAERAHVKQLEAARAAQPAAKHRR
jgi:uncharacterized protein HemX